MGKSELLNLQPLMTGMAILFLCLTQRDTSHKNLVFSHLYL